MQNGDECDDMRTTYLVYRQALAGCGEKHITLDKCLLVKMKTKHSLSTKCKNQVLNVGKNLFYPTGDTKVSMLAC